MPPWCTYARAPLAQVRNNTESTARQYGLADEAARLGWAAPAIEVIDADLGISGRSCRQPRGVQGGRGRVCLGEVGAIFGLEVSRLARSSADLSKLLELARLTDTLVIDADGVYDLSDINDRLVLGVKGTITETELHIFSSRLDQSRRAAAARGELRWRLPAGYVHDDEGAIVLDPDQEVQAAVADLFAAFVATGSAYGVVGVFAGRRFPRRPHGGPAELAWAPLTYDRVLKVLTNPAYAGAYAFGRHRSRRTVNADGTSAPARQCPPLRMGDPYPRPPPRLHQLGTVLVQPRPAWRPMHQHGARPPREGSAPSARASLSAVAAAGTWTSTT